MLSTDLDLERLREILERDIRSRSGTTNVGNVTYVDAVNGNDSTGVAGTLGFPFATLAAAVTATSAGQTIEVFPGVYSVTSNLWKDGVDFYFYQDCIINITSGIAFDDGGIKKISDVTGYAKFNISGGATLCKMTKTSAPISFLYLEFKAISIQGSGSKLLNCTGGQLTIKTSQNHQEGNLGAGYYDRDFSTLSVTPFVVMSGGSLYATFANAQLENGNFSLTSAFAEIKSTSYFDGGDQSAFVLDNSTLYFSGVNVSGKQLVSATNNAYYLIGIENTVQASSGTASPILFNDSTASGELYGGIWYASTSGTPLLQYNSTTYPLFLKGVTLCPKTGDDSVNSTTPGTIVKSYGSQARTAPNVNITVHGALLVDASINYYN